MRRLTVLAVFLSLLPAMSTTAFGQYDFVPNTISLYDDPSVYVSFGLRFGDHRTRFFTGAQITVGVINKDFTPGICLGFRKHGDVSYRFADLQLGYKGQGFGFGKGWGKIPVDAPGPTPKSFLRRKMWFGAGLLFAIESYTFPKPSTGNKKWFPANYGVMLGFPVYLKGLDLKKR